MTDDVLTLVADEIHRHGSFSPGCPKHPIKWHSPHYCCPCGEHEVTVMWTRHVASHLLDAGLLKDEED